ncbi:MAG: energy transducer TonB [Candidatus Korarchaeota archaeon]|nr:energy transducer TonB [Candidatus Korarchaeota archaeon]NIU83755.1 AgmX/PglI C-terminal domain-containing protein [Candidatus Thorarchaeota archaeon]NIW12824.1 AgmX/PglI C-terminal domain-containing protein [Candidatus Thorarchaeota archaeon]NIW53250.1 AgmX/PglI C-terminal domain-containing protein [Candidatus Korarchaeota archaeon]
MESNVRNTGGQGFRLAGFPKEFERNFWETLDKRYYSILLITFFVVYGLTFILASRDWQLSEEDLSKLKEQVRQMVYEAEIITTDVEPEDVEVTVLETDGAGEGEDIGEEGQRRVSESATERLQRQRRGRASRAAQTRQMEQDVAGSGILAIATAAGGGGGGAYEDVLKGIAGGAGGVGDVGEVVEGTAGIAAASGSGQRTRVAKGGGYRGAGEGIGIDDLIEGEGVVGGASFKRQGDVTLGEDVELAGTAAGSGSRDAQSILSIINQNKTSIEYCYQKYLKLNPSLKGEIYLEVTITPEGRVSSVKVLRSTLADKKLESCITRTVNRWRGFGKIDPSLGIVRTRFKYIF